jgi:hypothetical protein
MSNETTYTDEFLKLAHHYSFLNQEAITQSISCGCFYCKTVFTPDQICEWVDEGNLNGRTALCPNCGIDSVIGSSSKLPVTDANFLEKMNSFWFS